MYHWPTSVDVDFFSTCNTAEKLITMLLQCSEKEKINKNVNDRYTNN